MKSYKCLDNKLCDKLRFEKSAKLLCYSNCDEEDDITILNAVCVATYTKGTLPLILVLNSDENEKLA